MRYPALTASRDKPRRESLVSMKMVRIVAGFLILSAGPAWAGKVEGACDFRFLGTSTLHDFSGKVRCLPFAGDLVTDETRSTDIPGMYVEVPVDEMETGNKDRDRQMRDMFGSDRFPRIHGTVRNVDVDAVRKAEAKEGKAVLDLSLRIRDIERRIPVTVTNLREEGDHVRFAVEFSVSLADFGLKAPSVLFIIRVGDKVIVKGNVELKISS